MWPVCVTIPNSVKMRQTVAEIWRFNGFFQNGAILDLLGAIGTSHDDHLVISIVVQILVKIDAVVSII